MQDKEIEGEILGCPYCSKRFADTWGPFQVAPTSAGEKLARHIQLKHRDRYWEFVRKRGEAIPLGEFRAFCEGM